MFNRIFPIIASVVLIAIYVLLFNFSLSKLEKKFENSELTSVFTEKTKNFFTSLSNPEKQLFEKLPCAADVDCPGKAQLKQKFDPSFTGEIVKRGLLLDAKGVEIFSGRSVDPKYNKLIAEAQKSGSAVFKETTVANGADVTKTISIIRVSDVVKEKYFNNKYILALVDTAKLDSSRYKLTYGVATLAPVMAIMAFFLIRGGGGAAKTPTVSGGKKEGGDVQKYIAEIENLKKVNIHQSQFLANFTHELRTPLNSIIGFSGLLKDQTLGTLGNPEYLKYANDINTSGVHLLSLINDILDYSKSEVGKLKVNITEVDVVKVIKQALSIISPRASESKVDLLQSFSNDYFILRLDPKRFKQIMLNLLSNSVKFTPEGGSVTVSVFPDLKGDRISIEVKDTGVGIAEKDIPTVMSLFGQVETDLNRKYEGTGIGLPFAKKLTTLMAGEFELKSQVGSGTAITLTFPFDKKLNAEYQELYKKQSS